MRDISFLLKNVNKPGRYTGNEWNTSRKDFHQKLKICLIYPDLYEIGSSNLSLRVLYQLLDTEQVFVDRAFMPDSDMAALLTSHNMPLFGLNSRMPLKDFDILGFTLQHELTYTNVVKILRLSGISPLSSERTGSPLIIGGGPAVVNPEPLAGIFDVFHIGEAEETFPKLINRCLESGVKDFRENLKDLPGLYFPADYSFSFEGHKITSVTPDRPVSRVIVRDLDQIPLNLSDPVPNVSIIHDRIILEIQRGCDFGCRFCLAGYIYRPRRERSLENLVSSARKMLGNTGWEELSLSSLSSMCHSRISDIADQLLPDLEKDRTTLSLPSLRLNSASIPLFRKISGLKKTGITLVPEAGSEIIRKFMNKKIDESEIIDTASMLVREGWKTLKLYFMNGFVPESDDDILAIAEFCRKIQRSCGKAHITASVSHFVPKPHTPFQWEPFIPVTQLKARISLLKSRMERRVKLSYHDFESSMLEAVLARGDRRLTPVIIAAADSGACMDSWGEYFRPDLWEKAFKQCGVNPEWYLREHDTDEILPWQMVNTGVSKEFLSDERKRAYSYEESPSCNEKCLSCGVC